MHVQANAMSNFGSALMYGVALMSPPIPCARMANVHRENDLAVYDTINNMCKADSGTCGQVFLHVFM